MTSTGHNRLLTTVDASSLRRDGDVVTFDYTDGLGQEHRGFILRWNDGFHAYRNRCPHWSTPLDEDGPQIFDHGSRALVCQTHGALFEPETGSCISGPCMGQSLKKLRVESAIDETEETIEIYDGGLTLS